MTTDQDQTQIADPEQIPEAERRAYWRGYMAGIRSVLDELERQKAQEENHGP